MPHSPLPPADPDGDWALGKGDWALGKADHPSCEARLQALEDRVEALMDFMDGLKVEADAYQKRSWGLPPVAAGSGAGGGDSPPPPWRRDPYPSSGRTFAAWMSDGDEARVFFDAEKSCLLQSPTGARLPVGLEVLAWRDLEVVAPPDPSFDTPLQPQALRSADRDEDSLVGTSDHRPVSRSQGLGRQHWMPYPVPSRGSWRGHQLQKRGDDY